MFLILTLILFLNIPSGKIEVTDAWMRPAAKGMNSALYLKIFNSSNKPDTLYKISSNIAKTILMHETYEKEKDLMVMREVKNVVIKPHSVFEFKPRSFHIMLIGIKKNINDESKEEVLLYFKNSGKIKAEVSVRDD